MKPLLSLTDNDEPFQNSIILEISKSKNIDDLYTSASLIASHLKFEGAYLSVSSSDYDDFSFWGDGDNHKGIFQRTGKLINYGTFSSAEPYAKNIFKSPDPLAFDLVQLAQAEQLPDHFKHCVQMGYKTLLPLVVRSQSIVVGIIWLAGQDNNELPHISNSIITDWMIPFGTVLNNIISNITTYDVTII